MISPDPIVRRDNKNESLHFAPFPLVGPGNTTSDAVSREVAIFCVLILLSCVMWVYRSHGYKGQFLILTYIGSLVATQASVTIVFRVCPDFNGSCFLTACQLLLQSVVSHFLVRTWRLEGLTSGGEEAAPASPSNKVTAGLPALVAEAGGLCEWLQEFGPLALCLSFSLLAHNASIMYIGLGLSSVLSAFSAAVTMLFCAVLGQHFPCMAWLGVAIVSLGGIVTVSGLHLENADRNKAIGCGLAMVAVVMRAAKAAQQELLMSRPSPEAESTLGGYVVHFPASGRDGAAVSAIGAASEAPGLAGKVSTTAPPPSPRRPAESRSAAGGAAGAVAASGIAARPQRKPFDPLEVLTLQAPLMFASCAVASALTESLEPWRSFRMQHVGGSRRHVANLVLAILFSCALSCFLAVASLSCIKLVGATSSQIVGKFNVLITSTVAMVFMHEKLEPNEIVGCILLVAGAYIFEREVRDQPAATLGEATNTGGGGLSGGRK